MIIFNINDFILLNDEFNILSNIVLQADPELTVEFFGNNLINVSTVCSFQLLRHVQLKDLSKYFQKIPK